MSEREFQLNIDNERQKAGVTLSEPGAYMLTRSNYTNEVFVEPLSVYTEGIEAIRRYGEEKDAPRREYDLANFLGIEGSVSRSHATITLDEDGFEVEDNGSSRGTFYMPVGKGVERIASKRLGEGTHIFAFGNLLTRFVYEPKK